MTIDWGNLSLLRDRASDLLAKTKAEKLATDEALSKSTDYGSSDYITLQKKLSKLTDKEQTCQSFIKAVDDFNEAVALITDPALSDLAKEQEASAKDLIYKLSNDLFANKPKFQNVIIEIRAGAGGTEAGLFAEDLFRMYSLFANENGWKIEISDSEMTEKGGYKHLSAYIEGDEVYYWLQNESGVHRVQRVPSTESSGRIHTSTATVAILPDVQDDIEIDIPAQDILMEACRSSGPGGQYVNKTSSAVRITHLPTGIFVTSQENRSQLKNRETAMRTLKAKLYQIQLEEQQKEIKDLRRSQIGTADRSEKIRTYNYPQSRVTDHRVKKSWFNLVEIMDGKIGTMLSEIRDMLEQNITGSDE